MVEHWEQTVQLLQPPNGEQLVTKPHLKPDLLQKVPFKFLHDVITAVLKRTNFANGLYSAEQLNRKWDGFDKDKVGKEANQNRRKFLSDILSVLSLSLDEEIQCDVKEVLRGKDAAGANRLLQNLAKASSILKLDGLEAVQIVKRKEDGQPDAEAQRPESRRAPTRAADCDAVDKGSAGQSQTPESCIPPVQTNGIGTLESQSSDRMQSDHAAEDLGRQHGHAQGTATAEPHIDGHQVTATLSQAGAVLSQPALELPLSHSATEAVTSTAPGLQVRPLTAKKAPPLASTPTQVKQRSRLQPPGDFLKSSGKQHGVYVFREDSVPEEEVVVDMLENAPSMQSPQRYPMHGVLVNEMYKAKNTAEASQVTGSDQVPGVLEGIHLGRSKRPKHRTGLHIDLPVIQQAVEKLVQQITPLSRTMEYLQEDKENMQKELGLWRSEAAKWGERLNEEVQAHSLLDNAPLNSLHEQIKKHKLSIKQLQRQILLNDQKIEGMVHLVIGDM